MKHNPLIPMGAITGKPTRNQLRKRLEDYKELGIDQFMIYPRTGMELEYMSEEWLEACRHIIECADEYDMAIWLYDEYNWPSGQCKGQVIKDHPEFHAQILTACKGENGQIIWDIVTCKEMADVLNPIAMNQFLKLTHEKYFKCFKQYFGKVIKGIFTDEPSYAYAVSTVKNTTDGFMNLPYYDGLEDDYLKKTGRDLRCDIEKNLKNSSVEDLWKVFYNLIGKQFKKAFFSPIRKWCDEHNVLFTGHLMGESTPRGAVSYSGTPFKCIQEMSLPGIDEIFTFTDIEHIEWLTLNMVRNAAQRQGNGALAELFALGPVDMPFGKLRQMIYLMAMHGVDHYVLAVSPLDARGNIEKYQYFTAFTPLQTYFEEMQLLQEIAMEAGSIARKKLVSNSIAIKFPSALASADAGNLCNSESEDIKKITIDFNILLQKMIRHQWPIRLILEDEELASETSAVISMSQDGWILETNDGEISNSSTLERLFELLEQKLKRHVQVLEPDNNIADNLLVEEYEDGVYVLNLTEKDRPQLKCQGKDFALPSMGLKIINNNTVPRLNAFSTEAVAADHEFKLSLERNNIMRCCFSETLDDISFRFFSKLMSEISGIKLLLRRYSNNTKAVLDGKEITCSTLCTELTPGMNELYRESEEFVLTPGEHVLQLSKEEKDVMFLPLAMFSGNFGLYPGFMLKELPEKVSIGNIVSNGLMNYAGKIILKSNMIIPESAELLRLNTGEQITMVKFNGIPLGTRAWAPFEWEIPDGLKGKSIICEITQTLSIAPIFGKYDPNSTILAPTYHSKDHIPGKYSSAGCLTAPEWLYRNKY